MPRYFQSLGAGRPINLGGRTFIFEPVEPMGGSWAGVLAVDEESAANILASAGLEIDEARYLELKKKVAGRAQDSTPSRRPPNLPPQPIVVSASRAEDRIASTSEAATPAPDAKATEDFELATTSAQPPVEAVLMNDAPKRRKSTSA